MDIGPWLALLDAHEYSISREVIQRGVAAVYVLAFLSSFHQFPALLGERGLLPAPDYLARTAADPGRSPSLFRWRAVPYSDRALRTVCVLGMALGAAVVLGLPQAGPAWAPMLVLLAMWGLYLSINSLGQRFYGFGWESMLLETGFVVAFLGSHAVAPPLLVILFLRWLLLRLEFGAGMIKMRGDAAWRNLTAMDHHHQTQPMPNPLSRFAHQKPAWWHRAETLGSHIVQLGAPWLLLLPQPLASIGAGAIILTQLFLVLTGNYAWLNWLTILIATSGISDPVWRWLLGGPWPGWGWERTADALAAADPAGLSPLWWQVIVVLVVAGLVALSRRPLRNLFRHDQLMNASFNRFHLVNAYGAFGSMTRIRREVIIEGTEAENPREEDWLPFEFRGKPGDVHRRPGQFAPYHLRLDWMMWFVPLGQWHSLWFARLLEQLRRGDPGIRHLLRHDPFAGRAPRDLRVRVFEYRYASRAERRATGAFWVRREVGELTGARPG
ncbi:lipase maturation factor family protein [Brachybacterium phenoliresistens]|uniref:Membrane protein n=1 Tax=Brachybacterium phenoliresistens TaxID=396014 RepID=Z9JNF6_9MICO|nr:lipase maturation factor family protein [Brachybacterium phenoliresistens]EWS79709.1 membrane protein [Brachybacterium phenoliresistens]